MVSIFILFYRQRCDCLNNFTLSIAKNTYPLEVLIYSIKYSPRIISFEIDDSSSVESFLFFILTDIENFNDLKNHVMERIYFSFLRYEISQRTQTERELIVGRALYRSCVSLKESE